MQGFVHGHGPDAETPEDLAAVARAAAIFHERGRAIEPPPDLHRAEPRDRFGKASASLEMLAGALSDTAPETAPRLREVLDRARAQAPPGGPRRLLHGDLDLPNALLTENGCVLLDLDDVHVDARVSDVAWLATLVAAMSRTRDGPGYTFRRAWDERLLRAVVDGYASVAPLTGEERASLRGWLATSLVCASVDAFHHGGWLLPPDKLAEEAARATTLADAVPSL